MYSNWFAYRNSFSIGEYRGSLLFIVGRAEALLGSSPVSVDVVGAAAVGVLQDDPRVIERQDIFVPEMTKTLKTRDFDS